MDVEQANRILELKPGAGFRQVSEAREDLLALWNPDRLSDHPRLRAKAARKIAEINQAYEVLMERLGQAESPADRSLDPRPEPTPSAGTVANASQAVPASGDQRASLYEEVFSKRKEEEGRQIPIWPIAGGLLFLILGIFIYQFWSSEEVPGNPEAVATEEPASGSTLPDPAGESISAPVDDPAEGLPDATAAAAVDIPVKAPSEEPAAERAVAAPPRAEPPPPARAPASTPPARRPPPRSLETVQRPALRREGAISEPTGEETGREEESRRRAEQFEQVFRDLLANSAAARKLVDEEFEDLRFARWQVVDETDSEIWIELVAQKTDGNAVHFTWAINPADGTTRALSAAARSLERSGQAN